MCFTFREKNLHASRQLFHLPNLKLVFSISALAKKNYDGIIEKISTLRVDYCTFEIYSYNFAFSDEINLFISLDLFVIPTLRVDFCSFSM